MHPPRHRVLNIGCTALPRPYERAASTGASNRLAGWLAAFLDIPLSAFGGGASTAYRVSWSRLYRLPGLHGCPYRVPH